MKIACLSGKGGAGKTLVAVNLAATADIGTYIDCDVEEPNGRLFFKPEYLRRENVCALLPEFDENKCTGCKKCVEFCRFHALIYVKDKPRVFSEVCHSCGGCLLVCKENAVSEKPKPIGIVEIGTKGKTKIVTGILNPGEATGIPVIRQALKEAEGTTVIDCPPGSACSVMESVSEADFCIVVVEPTAFGFHNFKMVYELLTLLNKPKGIVINKLEEEYGPLEEFINENGVRVLARIPYREDIAVLSASGRILSLESEEMFALFSDILKKAGGAP